VFVIGADRLADPDESATGAPDRGELPTFDVPRTAGRTLEVQLVGLEAGDTYAVELRRLRSPGVESGAALSYAADCEWSQWGTAGAYFTQPYISYRWADGPTTFLYDLTVQNDAGLDYYELVFSIAGRRASDGALFAGEEHFYVQVQAIVGDLNCDGIVDLFDIDPFVLALTKPAVYYTQYPDCYRMAADANGDGIVNTFDIDSFVLLLANG